MTTYLTKIIQGKTHHFRITVENAAINVTHGVFYQWLNKYAEGCGDDASAIAKQELLINEKLSEGFQITEFKETLENTVNVYDEAKWHYSGNFPEGIENFQAYIHTGMFLGWLIDKGLISDSFKKDHVNEIQHFKLRKLTGAQIFERCCDGVLMIEDISERGNRFALSYFDFDAGQYLNDYEKSISGSLQSLYYVADTWDNYKKLKQVLNKRFSDWEKSNPQKPFWKFW